MQATIPRALRWIAVCPLLANVMLISGNPTRYPPLWCDNIRLQRLGQRVLLLYIGAVDIRQRKGAVQYPVDDLVVDAGDGDRPVTPTDDRADGMVDGVGERPISGIVLAGRMHGQVDDDAVPRMVRAHGLPADGRQADIDVICNIGFAPVIGLGKVLARDVHVRQRRFERPDDGVLDLVIYVAHIAPISRALP